MAQRTKCAVKVLDMRKSNKKHVDNELALLRSLDHPHIVAVRDLVRGKHHSYIVLELLSGGDLFGRIATAERLTEADVKRHVGELLSAVHYMHSRGIVHRDLKPENLLLSEASSDGKSPSVLKISDFGLAIKVTETGMEGDVAGTLEFMAPEMVRVGAGDDTARPLMGPPVDMWACGCILYCMLYGASPFAKCATEVEMFRHILKAQVTFPEREEGREVSDEAVDLIRQLLVVDPEKRATAESALKHPYLADSKAAGSLVKSQAALQHYVEQRRMRILRAAARVVGKVAVVRQRTVAASAERAAAVEAAAAEAAAEAAEGAEEGAPPATGDEPVVGGEMASPAEPVAGAAPPAVADTGESGAGEASMGAMAPESTQDASGSAAAGAAATATATADSGAADSMPTTPSAPQNTTVRAAEAVGVIGATGGVGDTPPGSQTTEPTTTASASSEVAVEGEAEAAEADAAATAGQTAASGDEPLESPPGEASAPAGQSVEAPRGEEQPSATAAGDAGDTQAATGNVATPRPGKAPVGLTATRAHIPAHINTAMTSGSVGDLSASAGTPSSVQLSLGTPQSTGGHAFEPMEATDEAQGAEEALQHAVADLYYFSADLTASLQHVALSAAVLDGPGVETVVVQSAIEGKALPEAHALHRDYAVGSGSRAAAAARASPRVTPPSAKAADPPLPHTPRDEAAGGDAAPPKGSSPSRRSPLAMRAVNVGAELGSEAPDGGSHEPDAAASGTASSKPVTGAAGGAGGSATSAKVGTGSARLLKGPPSSAGSRRSASAPSSDAPDDRDWAAGAAQHAGERLVLPSVRGAAAPGTPGRVGIDPLTNGSVRGAGTTNAAAAATRVETSRGVTEITPVPPGGPRTGDGSAAPRRVARLSGETRLGVVGKSSSVRSQGGKPLSKGPTKGATVELGVEGTGSFRR